MLKMDGASARGCYGGFDAVHALLGLQPLYDRPDGPAKTEGPAFAVEAQDRGAQDFREFARGDPAQEVHLPETILGGNVALDPQRVFERFGLDVRNAEAVATWL